MYFVRSYHIYRLHKRSYKCIPLTSYDLEKQVSLRAIFSEFQFQSCIAHSNGTAFTLLRKTLHSLVHLQGKFVPLKYLLQYYVQIIYLGFYFYYIGKEQQTNGKIEESEEERFLDHHFQLEGLCSLKDLIID